MLSIKGFEELEKELKKILKSPKVLAQVLELLTKYVDTNPMQKAFTKPRDIKACVSPTKKERTEEEVKRADKGVYVRSEAESMKADKNNPNA